MTLLRMWRGEKIRVARINSLRGNPPLSLFSTRRKVRAKRNFYSDGHAQ